MKITTIYGVCVPMNDLRIKKMERNCGCPIINPTFQFCPHCGNKLHREINVGYLFDADRNKWGPLDVIPSSRNNSAFIGCILGTFDTNKELHEVCDGDGELLSIMTMVTKRMPDQFSHLKYTIYTIAKED